MQIISIAIMLTSSVLWGIILSSWGYRTATRSMIILHDKCSPYTSLWRFTFLFHLGVCWGQIRDIMIIKWMFLTDRKIKIAIVYVIVEAVEAYELALVSYSNWLDDKHACLFLYLVDKILTSFVELKSSWLAWMMLYTLQYLSLHLLSSS